ncbi:hypothetical protein PC121_g22558 [Phytophthora cactorum]|nr:hypothetical protein PC120_g16589 [Phytophthora cactorum]KAG3043418.1 hypothetical protein PC121_g22558 [Phytophthora cactorum]KAG4037214.1 hypothetical protein PC123_g27219 [Phytophthora cactorum]
MAIVSSSPLHTLKDFRALWESIPSATDRERNPEKMVDMNAKIKPYVPKEFVNDDLYAAPTAAMVEKTAKIKRKRRERATARIAAKIATNDEGKVAAALGGSLTW